MENKNCENMKIEKLDFDFSVCRELYESAPRNDKEYKEAVEYFHERVFYTRGGLVFYYDDGKLVCDTRDNFESNNMNGFIDSKLKDAIRKKIVPYRSILEESNFVIDKEKRLINFLKPSYVSTIPDTVTVGEKGLKYVEHFKKYVREVLASENSKVFDIIMKFCAKTVKRQKCTIALIIVSSTEGTGKTTLSKLIEAILGPENCCAPKEESLLRFNYECFGKSLLRFEETEGVRSPKVFDVLKNMTTDCVYNYERKNKDAGDLRNISNIFMSSNFPVLFAGRRAMNVTPSSKWLRRTDLFKKLYDFDDECIKALYQYLLSFDTDKWNEQDDVYEFYEKEGNLKAIEQMNNVFQFMKENYALSRQSKLIKKTELYDNYVTEYAAKAFKKSTFYEKIKELNIEIKKYDSDMYSINGDELYDQFKLRNLICDEDNSDLKRTDSVDFILAKENDELKKQIEELKNKILELEAGGKKVDNVVKEAEGFKVIKLKVTKKN